MCNYFALTSPILLAQIWVRRELESNPSPFSQSWVGEGLWMQGFALLEEWASAEFIGVPEKLHIARIKSLIVATKPK